jgi:hypothetical protein
MIVQHYNTMAGVTQGLDESLQRVVDYILAEISPLVLAIKDKTDDLGFSVAGKIDANIQYINEVEVRGVGTEADPWNPA